MKLEPVRTLSEPSYPTYHRHPEVRRWLRRAAAVGATSLALALGACNGCHPFRTAGEPPPVERVDETQLPGAMRPPEPPAPGDTTNTPEPSKPPPVPEPPEEVRMSGAVARPLPPTPGDAPKPPGS